MAELAHSEQVKVHDEGESRGRIKVAKLCDSDEMILALAKDEDVRSNGKIEVCSDLEKSVSVK